MFGPPASAGVYRTGRSSRGIASASSATAWRRAPRARPEGGGEEAAATIAVEYEELPAIFDPEGALAPDAPVLHPDAAEYTYFGGPRPPRQHPNAQGHVVHEHGDVASGFESAAAVFEHEFRVPRVP